MEGESALIEGVLFELLVWYASGIWAAESGERA